jgi:hypothetical protein
MSESRTSPLLARYQRPLSFGALLDETFGIYRRNWLALTATVALSVLPGLLLAFVAGGAGLASLLANPRALDPDDFESVTGVIGAIYGGLAGLVLVYALVILIFGAAVALMTDAAMRGERLSVWRAYGGALRKTLVLVGAGFLVAVGTTVLVLLSFIALIAWAFPGFFGLVPLGLTVWWATSPIGRRPWVKWLLIATTPFGLVTYYVVKWSLFAQAVVLEGAGPLGAIQRSSKILGGYWFRLFGALFIINLSLSILQGMLAGLLQIVLLIFGLEAFADSDNISAFIAFQVATQAASLVGWVLFGALPFIASTIAFHDARNRREGSDLSERLASFEGTAGA